MGFLSWVNCLWLWVYWLKLWDEMIIKQNMFGKSLRVFTRLETKPVRNKVIQVPSKRSLMNSLAFTTDSYINLNKYEIKAKGVEREPLLTKIKHWTKQSSPIKSPLLSLVSQVRLDTPWADLHWINNLFFVFPSLVYGAISQNSPFVYRHPFTKTKVCHPSQLFWFLLVNNTLG